MCVRVFLWVSLDMLLLLLPLLLQVDEPAAAAGPTPAAPSKPAAPRDAPMADADIDDDLQKALALSMQVGWGCGWWDGMCAESVLSSGTALRHSSGHAAVELTGDLGT